MARRIKPGMGRKFSFHGAFGTKAKAKKREKKIKGSFIEEIKIKGKTRYVVAKPRKGK